MNYKPEHQHLNQLVPLIEQCVGLSAVSSLDAIHEYIATNMNEGINTITFIFTRGAENNISPTMCLTCGFILKSIFRKINSDRDECAKALVEAQNIGNVGDPSMGRELLSSIMDSLNNQYITSNKLHQAVQTSRNMHILLFYAITRPSSTVTQTQKSAASLIAERVRVDGMHCFTMGRVLNDVYAHIQQRITAACTDQKADLKMGMELSTALQSQNILILLSIRVWNVLSRLNIQHTSDHSAKWAKYLHEISSRITNGSEETELLDMIVSPQADAGAESLIGLMNLLLVIIEEHPIAALCSKMPCQENPLQLDSAGLLFETFLSTLNLTREISAQGSQSQKTAAYTLADISLRGIIIVLNSRNSTTEELQLTAQKYNERSVFLEEQLYVAKNQRNWNLDDLLQCIFDPPTFSVAVVDTITQSLIAFVVECIDTASVGVEASTQLSIEKNVCMLFNEILSYMSSNSCSAFFLSQLSSICVFLKQKLERLVHVPELHGQYAINSIGGITLQNHAALQHLEPDGALSIGSLALEFFLSSLEMQVGSNILKQQLAEIVPLLMVLLAYTKDEYFQEYQEADDDFRIPDQPGNVKRQAILRHDEADHIEEISGEENVENNENDDESEVEQWSIRMSAGLLLDEIACTYGETAVLFVLPEIHERIAQYKLSKDDEFYWVGLEAALLALGAISEGAHVCFPSEALVNLIIAALNVAKGSVPSHTLAKSMAFWALSKYALHFLEYVTNPEKANSTCETILVETLTTCLSTMRTTESKVVQEAATSCLLAFLRNLPPPNEAVRTIFSIIPSFMSAMVETFGFCYGRYQLKNKCQLFAVINELCGYDTHVASLHLDNEMQSGSNSKMRASVLEISLSQIVRYTPEVVCQIDKHIVEIAPSGIPDASILQHLPRDVKPVLPYILKTCSHLLAYIFHARAEESLRIIGARWITFTLHSFIALGRQRYHCQQQREDTDEGLDDILLASIYVLLDAAKNPDALQHVLNPFFFGGSEQLFAPFSEVLVQLIYGDDTTEIMRKTTLSEFCLRMLNTLIESYESHFANAAPILLSEFKGSFHLFGQFERRMCGQLPMQASSPQHISMIRVILVLVLECASTADSHCGESEHTFTQFLHVLRAVAHASSINDVLKVHQVELIAENLMRIILSNKSSRKSKSLSALCFAALGCSYSGVLVKIDPAYIIEIIRLMLSHMSYDREVRGLLQTIIDIIVFQSKQANQHIGEFFLYPEFFDMLLAASRNASDATKETAQSILRMISDEAQSVASLDMQSMGTIRRNYKDFIEKFRGVKGANYCRTLLEKLSEIYAVSLLF